MNSLSMRLEPRSIPRLPAEWGGTSMSGPRIEQLLQKFACRHLNVPLSAGGSIRPTDWTRESMSADFGDERMRRMQDFLGPADGALLAFQGATVEQDGNFVHIHSRYIIGSADVGPRASVPVIGPDRQEIIKQALHVAVGNHVLEDLKSKIIIKCTWEASSLSLEISFPV